MRKASILLLAIVSLATCARGAEVPVVEKLLPADTLLLVSTPDFSKASAAFRQAPLEQFWNDPAMQPFRQKFEKKFREDVIDSMEKELGIRVADYMSLAQGQLSLAMVQDGWQGKPGTVPGWVFLLDARQESTNLTLRLGELRKKWTDSGRQLKTEKIRDVEFTTIFVKPEDLSKDKSKPGPAEPGKASKPYEITIGQSDTLLLAGSSPQLLEKVLIRRGGGAVPGLNEQANWESSQQLVLREGLAYAWLHMAPIYEVFNRMATESAAKTPQDNPMVPSQAKIMAASGLSGLQTIALSMSHAGEGGMVRVGVAAPAARRQGLLKALTLEARESSAPGFVPAGVVKFRRWRLDGQKVWNGLETLINQISPQLGGVLQMSLGALGKDKDPNFDFRKRFIANLGDDMISFERAPRSNAAADVDSPPSIFLLGSPKPEEVAEALRAGASLLPAATGEAVKERAFQGRKIYTLAVPSGPGDEPGKPKEFLFAASGNYLAMSSDASMIEEYLRNTDTTGKPLREVPGLTDAAQKVGGTSLGIFGYDNYNEGMKWAFESVKAGGPTMDKLLGGAPVGPKIEVDENLKEWFDFSLLPTYERVEKYFHFSVLAGGTDERGFQLKFFSPTPPKLKAP